MAVRIRLKRMGRRHRPFFRICAMDARVPRDGRAIEELGYYDPTVRDVDARAVLKADRIDYWLDKGAKPTEKVDVLIKKYGTNGTHRDQQKAALERLKTLKPKAPPPMFVPKPKKQAPAAADGAAPGEAAPGEAAPGEAAPERESAQTTGGSAGGEAGGE
ncbi:MAG: 30S ribosomal protein S16 [Planctomycetes bacterium]|nr:30S ribosomal protein S16 [Planctomycetota bacterium]